MKLCDKCDYLGVDAPCARCGSTMMRSVSSDILDCLVRWQHGETGRICELPPGHLPGHGWDQTGRTPNNKFEKWWRESSFLGNEKSIARIAYEAGAREALQETAQTIMAVVPEKKPIARNTDTSTSIEAANSVSRKTVSEVMREILTLLNSAGPLTDQEIYQEIKCHVKTSTSGCRTRRSELVAAGLVTQATDGKTKTGRRCHRWQLTVLGSAAVLTMAQHPTWKFKLGDF